MMCHEYGRSVNMNTSYMHHIITYVNLFAKRHDSLCSQGNVFDLLPNQKETATSCERRNIQLLVSLEQGCMSFYETCTYKDFGKMAIVKTKWMNQTLRVCVSNVPNVVKHTSI